MVLRSMAEPRITERNVRPATIIVSRMVLLWQARHPLVELQVHGLRKSSGSLAIIRRHPAHLSVLRVTFLVFVRDYLRWSRPWIHVAKATISQRVRIARCERAVLAVPVHVAFSKAFHRAPGSIAKSTAGRSSKRRRRCKSSDTKRQFCKGFQHNEPHRVFLCFLK